MNIPCINHFHVADIDGAVLVVIGGETPLDSHICSAIIVTAPFDQPIAVIIHNCRQAWIGYLRDQ